MVPGARCSVSLNLGDYQNTKIHRERPTPCAKLNQVLHKFVVGVVERSLM